MGTPFDARREMYERKANSLGGAELAEVISSATVDPLMIHFAELLSLPAAQEVRGVCLGCASAIWAVISRGRFLWGLPLRWPTPCRDVSVPIRGTRSSLQLGSTPHAGALDLLKLFAHGTWADYAGECGGCWAWVDVEGGGGIPCPAQPAPRLPPRQPRVRIRSQTPPAAAGGSTSVRLSGPQERKLKALTVMSLAATKRVRRGEGPGPCAGREDPGTMCQPASGCTSMQTDAHAVQQSGTVDLAVLLVPVDSQRIGFEELVAATGSSSTQEMEGVVVSDCLGPGLIAGQLDHASSCLVAESCQPRDVAPEELPAVATALSDWWGLVGGRRRVFRPGRGLTCWDGPLLALVASKAISLSFRNPSCRPRPRLQHTPTSAPPPAQAERRSAQDRGRAELGGGSAGGGRGRGGGAACAA